MSRILFLPSDHGGGLGHVSRCVYLAHRFQDMGHDCAMVLENKHYHKYFGDALHCILLDTRSERFSKLQFKYPFYPRVKLNSKLEKPPVFNEISSLGYQVVRDEYLSSKIVIQRFKKIKKAIDAFKPTVLIGDTHFLTRLLGAEYDIPVIQNTRYAGFPNYPDFLWWKPTNSEQVEPNSLEPFQELQSIIKSGMVSETSDLLRGDKYIVPSIPLIEPIQWDESSLIFTGPFSQSGHNKNPIDFFDEHHEYPKIFVTIGGGAGRGQEYSFFLELARIFKKTNYKVLITTGNKIKPKVLNSFAENVHFVNWIDGISAIGKSDLVIHHGGYGTTMETLLSAKPSIVMPSHSEQEGNGMRLESLGLGNMIPIYSDELTPLSFEWPFGVFTVLSAFKLSISKNILLTTVENLLNGMNNERLESVSKKLVSHQNFDLNTILEF